jgi:hypothetical protein
MKKILIIVPDGGMLFESAGIADILMQANRLHPEGAREICYQVKLATTPAASGYPWSVRFKSAGRPSSA